MRHSVGDEHRASNRARAARAVFRASSRGVRIYLSFSLNCLLGIALFMSVACAFYISPVHYLMDGQFSLLMDEALIHEWTPNMIRYQVPRGHGDIFVNDGYPWQIRIIRGRLLYVYPWGSPLLSLPAVAVFNADGFKIAPHRSRYKYSWSNELRMQILITTAICALTIWVAYIASDYFLPFGWSLTVALAAALGTPIWSSASRSLWPQAWSVLLMMIAILILLSGSIRPFILGTVLAWSCLTRPTLIPQVAAITLYMLVTYDHRFLWRYIAGGLCSAIPVCALMFLFTGGLFSVAYPLVLFDFPHEFWLRLYGLLLSPSRGLLVFSPVFLIPVYLVIRYWKVLPERCLAVLALAAIGMHFLVLSSYSCWWAGAYGPRLMLEVVPWFVLLAILGIRAFVEDRSLSFMPRLLITSVAAFTLAISIATNAPGALVRNAGGWRSVDQDHLDVLWDWHDPQFLCWIRRSEK